MTTTEPATPLPVPIVPSSGAMSAASSRSAVYCTGPLRARYTSDPFVGCVSLTTRTTLPSASATTLRLPCSPASRLSYCSSMPDVPMSSPSSTSRPSPTDFSPSSVTEPVYPRTCAASAP